MQESLVEFIGPYNARQRSSSYPYNTPERKDIANAVKHDGVNDFTFHALVSSTVAFCEQTKGMRALPTPHPANIHNIQLPRPAFDFSGDKLMLWEFDQDIGITAPGIRDQQAIKFIIVRPKVGASGMPSSTNWEMLTFKNDIGYLPEWIDSTVNPRYVGRF